MLIGDTAMTSRKSNSFYGWYVLAASFTILFLVQGSRAVIGVTFKPIIQEFAWSRASVSLAVFLNMIVLALALTAIGTYYDRYGARRVITLSTLFAAGGFIGIALADTLWQFLLCFGFIAAIGFAGASIPLFAALMAKWFAKHRGLAVSLALGGGSLGHFVVVQFSNYLVIGFNWRLAYLVCGLVILVVNLGLVWVVIQNQPSDMDLVPYGEEKRIDVDTGAPEGSVAVSPVDLSLFEAMRTRFFWLFMTVMVVCGGGDYLVLTHLVPMATDHGISQQTAGDMLAWYGIVSLAGVLAAGRATDKLGNIPPITFTFVLRFLVFLLIIRIQNVFTFYAFALLFGFTHLITAPITTTLMGRLYGFTHIGLLTGVITTVHHLSGGIWAFWGGVAFDMTGSYRMLLICYAAASLLAVLCSLLIREARHDPRR